MNRAGSHDADEVKRTSLCSRLIATASLRLLLYADSDCFPHPVSHSVRRKQCGKSSQSKRQTHYSTKKNPRAHLNKSFVATRNILLKKTLQKPTESWQMPDSAVKDMRNHEEHLYENVLKLIEICVPADTRFNFAMYQMRPCCTSDHTSHLVAERCPSQPPRRCTSSRQRSHLSLSVCLTLAFSHFRTFALSRSLAISRSLALSLTLSLSLSFLLYRSHSHSRSRSRSLTLSLSLSPIKAVHEILEVSKKASEGVYKCCKGEHSNRCYIERAQIRTFPTPHGALHASHRSANVHVVRSMCVHIVHGCKHIRSLATCIQLCDHTTSCGLISQSCSRFFGIQVSVVPLRSTGLRRGSKGSS